ncbi:hypothetical protein G1K46_02345 [Tenacibaculum finnmarkense]|nr:hypothetical protein [Tenacibaculum finnmarkense]MBE7691861.1 hypothetical protein [Tenacibaculum finnmarkense genomovar finnmarkense]MBE7686845.1 hypothetical protein [Tenacibaculum finnmarkense genomovar ulcerans]MCD8453321.1 hypothetical protein [Tenacibaculum finnmarkense genomovar ulcerans]MCG8761576.1 hypothetical protein [Tenacibaculum finnmarkense]MCG8807062.1 hypothetical protein [Tenacibaculum finnmarkense]
MKNLSVVAVCLMMLTSCMTTKTTVGNYKESQSSKYTYAKGKQVWVFWGLIPLGRTNVNTPNHGNCQIITRYNLGDILISALTGGIVTTYTIKVKAKRDSNKKDNNSD